MKKSVVVIGLLVVGVMGVHLSRYLVSRSSETKVVLPKRFSLEAIKSEFPEIWFPKDATDIDLIRNKSQYQEYRSVLDGSTHYVDLFRFRTSEENARKFARRRDIEVFPIEKANLGLNWEKGFEIRGVREGFANSRGRELVYDSEKGVCYSKLWPTFNR